MPPSRVVCSRAWADSCRHYRHPPPADPYRHDGLLRSWLDLHLGKDRHASARPRLEALAADVTGPLRQAHLDAEANPPQLVRYDPPSHSATPHTAA